MTTENTRRSRRKETKVELPEAEPATKKDGPPDVIRSLRKQVLLSLGYPGDLLQVQVRPLWEDRYRVNVFRGADVTCAKVAHSYFVATDGEGNLVKSSPNITKQY